TKELGRSHRARSLAATSNRGAAAWEGRAGIGAIGERPIPEVASGRPAGPSGPSGRGSSGERRRLASPTAYRGNLRVGRATRLQVAACGLLALDGLEQRLEVALAEALAPFPLDDLEEQRRAVGDGAGEDLQQIAVVVS